METQRPETITVGNVTFEVHPSNRGPATVYAQRWRKTLKRVKDERARRAVLDRYHARRRAEEEARERAEEEEAGDE